MVQNVFQCMTSVNVGLSQLKTFDRILASGDVDQATDRLMELWGKMFEPTKALTNLYDGEFWSDWSGRQVFEDNLQQVYDLLSEFEKTGGTVSSLEKVRTYLHANFMLLQDVIRILTADVGIDRLKLVRFSADLKE